MEKLLDCRRGTPSGTREFLVKWLGYVEADNTWELRENLDRPPRPTGG